MSHSWLNRLLSVSQNWGLTKTAICHERRQEEKDANAKAFGLSVGVEGINGRRCAVYR